SKWVNEKIDSQNLNQELINSLVKKVNSLDENEHYNGSGWWDFLSHLTSLANHFDLQLKNINGKLISMAENTDANN
ncbi:MAG: hypothetical protein JKY54_15030, partial [Flavobacteriales bacterium]|nr:hypothetical protein [Flavobacteriales bacterium]